MGHAFATPCPKLKAQPVHQSSSVNSSVCPPRHSSPGCSVTGPLPACATSMHTISCRHMSQQVC